MQNSMKKPNRSGKKTYVDRAINISNQGDFMFNKTSILSSALQKLKRHNTPKPQKRPHPTEQPSMQHAPTKKIKTEIQNPSLTFSPLHKDLYNFYTINKVILKSYTSVPEPNFQMGSLVLTALCDRGIGGKYLVGNLFRNKKAYIDFMNVSLMNRTEKSAVEATEKYDQPGHFIIGMVVKSRTQGKVQLSLSDYQNSNDQNFRVGQVVTAQLKSKEELGCHLIVKGIKKYKFYLPKDYVSSESYENLIEGVQVIVVIKEINESKKLLKVSLSSEETLTLNLKGIQQQQMSKMQLESFVHPSTLLNTKVIKILSNGVMVKFLKIFIGFIHQDHLLRNLNSYAQDQKILCRVIYLCNSPPLIYLSEKHIKLQKYQPSHELYSSIKKPQHLTETQGSYLNKQQQFYSHPLHLHSEINNINKFWVKEYNYFEKYQIVSSRKIGIRVGQVSKVIPFNNFKVFGSNQNQDGSKFRVMCLDVWNKVIKVSYDKNILIAKAETLLFDQQEIDLDQKYVGVIANINSNGVVIEFCNNIRGIISIKQLELNNINISKQNIGLAFETFVTSNKKSYLGLSLTPPALRKNKKSDIAIMPQQTGGSQQTWMGVIQSVDPKSIHPIYLKHKGNVIKVSIFTGIRPPSLEYLPVIQNLLEHFQPNQRVRIFQKKGQFYLYPPEQLSDKSLKYCRIIKKSINNLRVQIDGNSFKDCHACDISDAILSDPLKEFKIGQYQVCRVIDDKNVCLRKGFVQNGFPKEMQTVLQNYGQGQKNGDYRARIQAVGPSSLKTDMIAFGYVKAYNEKGCFISLSRNFTIRVQKSQLSDTYLSNPSILFPSNKLVLMRLIDMKVQKKKKKCSEVMFDASLRQSVVKQGYPIDDQVLQYGIGLTVQGMVTGYVKGKALVKINGSRFTGIIALKDLEGAQELTLEKALPMGQIIESKIIEYKKEGDKRLIRLSTLTKHFNKYKGFETNFEKDERTCQLWESYEKLMLEKKLQQQKQQEPEQNEYERLKKLLGENQIDIEEQQHDQDENQEAQQSQIDEQQEEEDQIQEQQQQEKENKVIDNRVKQFQSLPHPPSFYHSLVLANPTPESHLLYISSLLPISTPQQIRQQFEKSINSLSEVKDKDNLWISWINMELILGDLVGTVKKAVASNVGMTVFFRIIEILSQQENWEVAFEFGKKMLKKFNKEQKAYSNFLKMTSLYSLNHKIPETISNKQIMRRASQCLRQQQITQIEVQQGKYLFDLKEFEKGRNIFEELVSKYPKRSDIWSVYVDQEIKHEDVQKARNIIQRVLSLGLKKKTMVAMLKKYYQLQVEHGDKKSAQIILERAQAMAAQYQEERPESQDEK